MLETYNDIQSPFARLRSQLDGIPPGDQPIDLTIGAPRHQPPSWLTSRLQEAMGEVAKYPPIDGTAELQQAMINWAETRYPTLKNQLKPANCLPLNGSREGLFYAVLMAKARRPDISNPVVLIPNPYYQVYGAAALAAGATPYFLNSTKQTGFLPDLSSIPQDIASRTIAFYLCTPSNPEGAVADKAYLKNTISFARQHNLMLYSDECYSEIYSGEKPHSALEVAVEMASNHDGQVFDNVCIFNSLSKRSNVPGIRSGLIIGDETFMTAFQKFRNVAAPQIPGPIQHLSSLLWQDETHVRENRELYAEKFNLAENMLQNRYQAQKPAGGFFLWLNFTDFGGGKAAVSTLWKGCGLKLLPGAYLAQTDELGFNPGENYARMALVGSLEQTEQALERLLRVLK